MTAGDKFRDLSREERIALCREVVERLSDLVEGTAPDAFCERVEDLLGDCQPYQAYRKTLRTTIDLLRECGQLGSSLSSPPEDRIAVCVEKARRALENVRKEPPAG
jgi:hypothetical protein